jgi:hypothetical protein
MRYSFSKADRFLPTIKSQCDIYYNLPDRKSRRSTSFGFGNKIKLSTNSIVPPPGTYSPKSMFDSSAKSRGFSFGFGREVKITLI